MVPLATRGFLPDVDRDRRRAATPPADRAALTRWREPRTLLLGLFVLAFAFAEGAGNDWVSVALIDGHHAAAVAGTLGFAAFLTAMTARAGPARRCWTGTAGWSWSGCSRWSSVLGLVLFVFGGSTPVAFVGALLWGVGVSLGFPVGMSAAADNPAAAAGRVSVVASIGYCSFLGGPPLIGFLGSHLGVLHALTAVAVLLASPPCSPRRCGHAGLSDAPTVRAMTSQVIAAPRPRPLASGRMTSTATRPVGLLLREWRERRRLSQLELSSRAEISTRHLSFVETGRSRPTPEMILKLTDHLEVPLRERNQLLLAGGYAPAYPEHGLDAPELAASARRCARC